MPSRGFQWAPWVIAAVIFATHASVLAQALGPSSDGESSLGSGQLACPACRKVSEPTPHRNVILVVFSSVTVGRIQMQYERAVKRPTWFSVFAGGSVIAFDSVGNQNLVGFALSAGGRFYPRKRESKRTAGKNKAPPQQAPEGFWLAPSAGLSYRNERGNRDIKLIAGSGIAMAGWTGVWCRFALSVGAGVVVSREVLKVLDGNAKQLEVNPLLQGGLGVAFGEPAESRCKKRRACEKD